MIFRAQTELRKETKVLFLNEHNDDANRKCSTGLKTGLETEYDGLHNLRQTVCEGVLVY